MPHVHINNKNCYAIQRFLCTCEGSVFVSISSNSRVLDDINIISMNVMSM